MFKFNFAVRDEADADIRRSVALKAKRAAIAVALDIPKLYAYATVPVPTDRKLRTLYEFTGERVQLIEMLGIARRVDVEIDYRDQVNVAVAADFFDTGGKWIGELEVVFLPSGKCESVTITNGKPAVAAA